MRAFLAAVALSAVVSTSCSERVDLSKGLEVTDVMTGWANAGEVNGQNKMVPTITFRVKNVSDQKLSTLQANVLFRRVNEEEEWGSAWVRITGTEGLAPGQISEPQRVECPKGYTGTETRTAMMANSAFIDARVRIFAKYESTQWAPVAEFTVDRRLLSAE
jgi:hypothetical protein